MNNDLSKKIQRYSLLAGFTGLAGIAQGQIKYHDINPDIVQDDTTGITLDLDEKGGLMIKREIIETSTSDASYILKANAIYAYYTSNGSASILMKSTEDMSFSPALNKGDEIKYSMGSYTSWSSTAPIAGAYIGTEIKVNVPWNGAKDKYLGFRIFVGDDENGEGQFKYGWIRMDIAEDASSFTIKDYAINHTINKPIKAGEGAPE